jgi:hypothetical protein
MSLPAHNQDIIVLEPMDAPMMHNHSHSGPVPVPEHEHMDASHIDIDADTVFVVNDADIEIEVEDIPGAGSLHDLPSIVVEEAPEVEKPSQSKLDDSKDAKVQDENDARKASKKEKWDWESKGATGFVTWIKERLDSVPRHSGMDTAGLERAISYLEKLDSEISKAMRLDLDGDLDANKIEEVRSKIDDGLSRLHDRLDKVKKTKKNYKKKRSDAEFESTGLVKEAQKITGVQGVYVTVPLLVSRIARVCINGMVSAGHDIEDLYNRQVKFYKLNDREQAEVMQLLSDMGYALRQDRGFMPEDALEVSDSNGMDWASNFKG